METEPLSRVAEAAQWLADQPAPPAHVVPTLRERFGLNALQACEAIALARSAPAAGGERHA